MKSLNQIENVKFKFLNVKIIRMSKSIREKEKSWKKNQHDSTTLNIWIER